MAGGGVAARVVLRAERHRAVHRHAVPVGEREPAGGGEVGIRERPAGLRENVRRLSVGVVALLHEEGQEGDPPAVVLGQHVAGVAIAQRGEDGHELAVEILVGQGLALACDDLVELQGEDPQALLGIGGVHHSLEGQVHVAARDERERTPDDGDHVRGQERRGLQVPQQRDLSHPSKSLAQLLGTEGSGHSSAPCP